MQNKTSHTGLVVLLSASLVSVVLGSIHAFSVFLAPLETQFSATRPIISLTYSIALVTLTLAVLFGPRIYHRWSAARFMLMACVLASIGVALAGTASGLAVVWLGYSLIFGAANGLGYGFGLQIAAQANVGREGLAMGIVTAAYALGAVFSPVLFDAAIDVHGFQGAMFSLSGILLVVGITSAALMKYANARFQSHDNQTSVIFPSLRSQLLLWIGYFGGVLCGLMVIGQAAGIAISLQPNTATWLAPMIIAACNLLGSLVVGRLVDTLSLGRLLAGLAIMSTVALIALVAYGTGGAMMICFGLIGFAYGGTIAAYPAVIAKLYGMAAGPRIYGRVFTAWGTAGLLGPWFAGYLFSVSGNYNIALLTAAIFGAISVIAATLLLGERFKALNKAKPPHTACLSAAGYSKNAREPSRRDGDLVGVGCDCECSDIWQV